MAVRNETRPTLAIAWQTGGALSFRPLYLADLLDALRVTPSLKACAEPCPHDLRNLILRRGARPDGQDVRVVVLAREPRDIFRPGDRRAHPLNFVCGDGHPGA